MLLKTVAFDAECTNWTDDIKINVAFLKNAEHHLNTIIQYRGYVYLNQIYEHLGIKWNPEDENICIKNDNTDQNAFIEFKVFPNLKNSFLINIYSRE